MKYIIFDTNCFLKCLRNEKGLFEYDAIKKYAKENGLFIVISAYSLYEIIQNLSSVSEIELFRTQLISFGDFWVLNVNGILEHPFIEYGMDFLLSLSLNQNELLVEFSEKRKLLRNAVYKTLFRKMYFYSELAAVAFMVLNDCDSDGNCSQDVYWKTNYIDKYFFKEHKERYDLIFTEAYKHAGLPSYDPIRKVFYDDFDAKDSLRGRIQNLIIEILAFSNVELSLAKGDWEYNDSEYNERIIENCKQLTKEIHPNSFRQSNQRCLNRTKKKVSIRIVLKQMLADFPDNLETRSYYMLLLKLFESGGFGKSFNNDFIDFTNVGLLDKFPVGDTVYLTEESTWNDFIYENKNYPQIKETILFHKRFSRDADL